MATEIQQDSRAPKYVNSSNMLTTTTIHIRLINQFNCSETCHNDRRSRHKQIQQHLRSTENVNSNKYNNGNSKPTKIYVSQQ